MHSSLPVSHLPCSYYYIARFILEANKNSLVQEISHMEPKVQ